jgi:hypothetical protein
MATQPTTAAPPPGSARELVKAMRERNAPRRAEVQRRVASLRRIDEQLRAASRSGTPLKASNVGTQDGDGVRVVPGHVREA